MDWKWIIGLIIRNIGRNEQNLSFVHKINHIIILGFDYNPDYLCKNKGFLFCTID